MWSTACWTAFEPARPACANSWACVGRRRAMPNSTATKKPLSATRSSARTMRAAVTGPAYGTRAARDRPSGRRFGGLGVGQTRADVRRVLVGAGDDLVARLAVGLRQEARLHPEVDRLRVVGDDRDRRLLGLDRVPAAQPQSDG